MGLYRATLNMPEAKCGKIAEFDDTSLDVQRRVAFGHLVPVDRVALLARESLEIVTVIPTSSVDAIKQALAKARQEAKTEEAAEEAADNESAEASVINPALFAPDDEEDTPRELGNKTSTKRARRN